MKRSDVAKYLLRLEDEYPVADWKVENIQIWPIVKRDIFFLWHNLKENPIHAKAEKRTNAYLKLKITIKSFLKYFSLRVRKKSRLDIAFCGSEFHRIKHDGVFINRYYFPLIEAVKYKKYIEIEYTKRNGKENYKDEKDILFLDDFIPFMRFIRLFKRQIRIDIPELNELLKLTSNELGISINNYLEKLRSEISNILDCGKVFELIFDKYTPNIILGLCYYNLPMFAMHYIANKRNIENWDVQHGGQGSLHVMYNYKPHSCFNILPKYFWCWDNVSKQGILKWADAQSCHDVENKGNPWLEYQIRLPATQIAFPNKKIILYTVQETFLEPYIIDSIRETPAEFQWWIRLHPRMTESKKMIEDLLLANKILDKVEIAKACHYPLPTLLKNSAIHISKYSGSIIEAALLNVKSIIIDEIGVESYREYINNGQAVSFLTKDHSEFIRLILKLTSTIEK